MILTSITVTCPSCGLSRDIPQEKFPPRPLTVTCRSCGRAFPLTEHLAPDAGMAAEASEPMPAAAPSPPPVKTVHPPPGRQHPPSSKQGFVNTLAWIFIVLAGFATFISLLQNIMIATMFPVDKIHKAVNTADAQQQLPAMFRLMFDHFQLYFALFLVVSASTLASAVGLLKRKNWARLTFIVLMALAIAWNFAGIALQQLMISSFPKIPDRAPTEFRDRFETMLSIIRIFSLIMAVGMSVLFGWIIKRLTSPEVREEFVSDQEEIGNRGNGK